MDKQELTQLLQQVADGDVTPDDAALRLKMQPFQEIGAYAKVDFHRGIRQGVPEVIFGEGKAKEHILGMDEFGRDILLRIIWGTRYSLFMGAFAVLGASVLGGIIGAVAGYYNMMDTLLMRIMDVFLAIPTTLLAVAIVAAMGPSLVNVVLAIAISQTPTFARVIRAQVLTIKDQEFVEAARSAGATSFPTPCPP